MYRQGDTAPGKPLNLSKPSRLEANATFINFTHPGQRREPATRRLVAQYIGVNFRNRSKPVARKEANGPAQKSGRMPASQRQLRARGVPIQSWINRDLHGLRSDPFGSYPIQQQTWLSEAVDFFLNAYGPTHLLRRAGEVGVPGSKGQEDEVTEISPVHQYFRYSLQHPAMFEALVALSLSNLRIQSWEHGQADKETTFHYGNVLSALQKTLNEGDGFRETAVLWSILALLELEYLVGNMAAFEAHIRGLRRLVDLQGGLQAFDQYKLLGPAIRGALALWNFLNVLAPTHTCPSLRNLPANKQVLDDPHLLDPCKWGLCPKGSQDIGTGILQLVHEEKLTAPVIRQARDIYANWKDVDLQVNSPYGAENALNMEFRERGWDLVGLWHTPGHGGLTLADYILLMGLQHTLLDTTHAERFSPLYTPAILRWVSSCSSFLGEVDQATDASTTDLLIWACMKLAGTMTATFLRARSDSETDPRFQLILKMMGKYPATGEWYYLEQVMKKFQWREYCMQFWHMVWQMVVQSDAAVLNGCVA